MKKFTYLSLLLISLWIGSSINCQGQTPFWSENFWDYAEGTGIDGTGNIGDYPAGVTKWTLDVSNAILSDADDYIKTHNYKMEGRDIDGYIIWESESIDISAYSEVVFSLDASEDGTLEVTDYFDVYYKIDAGAFTLIPNWNGMGSDVHTIINDFPATTITKTITTGNTLVIRVLMSNNSSMEYHKLDNVMVYANMAYSSSTTTQNIHNIAAGKTNRQIIGMEIETSGTGNPISISQFTINANGSSTPVSNNIENAKIFYTGTDNTFEASNQFGSVYASPTTTNFNITGTQELSEGTNYFWLTFDTKAGATIGDVVDAECISFVISGSTETPTITAPAGSRTIAAPLSGDYTIGAAGDYTSFTDAVDELMALGINAPVTFTVDNGTYTEQILLSAIAGASATDTVIFQSSSGNRADVVLQYEPTSSSANHILKFDGTDYITFQNMTLQNTGTSAYGRVVVFAGATNNINLTGCNMNGRDANHENDVDYTVIEGESGTSNMASNITFDNDTIRYGSYGLYFNGGDNNNLETGIKISNSVFEDFYYAGIFLYYQDSIVVHRNKMTGKGVYDYEYGMFLMYCYGGYEITANMVFLSAPVVNSGIRLLECHASATRYALIANNYFSQVSTGGAYGIDVSDCSYQKIYHNSINMRSSAKSGSGGKFYPTVGCYFHCPNTIGYGFIALLNNIAKSSKKVISVTSNAVSQSYVEESNHNDWLTLDNILGNWGSTDCPDLTAWQAASGEDGSSVSVDPGFVSSEVSDVTEETLGESVSRLSEVPKDNRDSRRKPNTTPGSTILTNRWLGGQSTDWNDPQNWSLGVVPNANHNVVVNEGEIHHPVLSGDANCNSLTIDGKNADLNLNGHTINVGGNFKGNGEQASIHSGTLNFNGDGSCERWMDGVSQNDIQTGSVDVKFDDNSNTATSADLNAESITTNTGSTLNLNGNDCVISEDVNMAPGSWTNPGKVTFSGATNSQVTSGGNFLESVIVDKDGNAEASLYDALIAEALTILKGNLNANNKNIEISGDADLSGGNLSNDNKISFTGSGNSTVEFNDSYRYNHLNLNKDVSTAELVITPTGKKYKLKALTIERGKVVATGNEVDITGDADYSGGELNTDKITYSGSSNSAVTPGDGRQENVVVDKDSPYGIEITPTGKKYKMKAFTIERGTVLAAVSGPFDISGDADLAGGNFNANVTFSGTTYSTLTTGSTTMQEVIVDKDGNAGVSLYDALVAEALKIINGKLDANFNDIEISGNGDLSGGSVTNTNEVKFTGDENSELITGGNFLYNVVVEKEEDGLSFVLKYEAMYAKEMKILRGKMKAEQNVEITGKVTVGNSGTGEGELIVSEGKSVVVEDTITIEKTGKIKLKADSIRISKLIPKKKIVKKPGGVFIAERMYGGGEWHLISPPVFDAVAGMFNGKYLQYHSESNNAWTDIETTSYPLVAMHGYSLWSTITGNNLAEFEGTPNSGSQSFDFTYAGGTPLADYGWNLIGNPYTATLDWDQVTIPANLDGTIYLFDPSIGANGDYVYYLEGGGSNTADQYVALGQGFLVHCNNTAGGTLTFTGNEMVTNDATFYKSTEQAENSLVFNIDGHNSSKAEIRFIENSTSGFDSNLDVYKLISESKDVPFIYSSTVSGRLAINTLPSIESHNLVTVGFKVDIAGTYTIQFKGSDSFDPFTPIYLEDIKENIFVNLRENQSYTFDYNPGDEADRFKVHFAEPADSNEEGLSIYSAGNIIYILNPENVGSTVEVYNVMGQQIKTVSLNNNSTEIHINQPGNYIVRIIAGSEVVCTKLFIQ